MSPEGKLDLGFLRAGAAELATRSAGRLNFPGNGDPDLLGTNGRTLVPPKSDLDALGPRFDRLEVQLEKSGAKLAELQVAISRTEASVSKLNEGLSRLPRRAGAYFAALIGGALVVGAILLASGALPSFSLR